MHESSATLRGLLALLTGLLPVGCSADKEQSGNANLGGSSASTSATVATTGRGGAQGTTSSGGDTSAQGSSSSVVASGGNASSAAAGGGQSTTVGSSGGAIGTTNSSSRASGGASGGGRSGNLGGTTANGGMANAGGTSSTRTSSVRGGATSAGGAVATGGAALGGALTAGSPATGGRVATGGSSGSSTPTGDTTHPCDGTTSGYDAIMSKSGTTWTVTSGGNQKYSGTDTQAALTAAYNSLTSGRKVKQSILVQGDGDIPATAQFAIPSFTVLNWCGTLNVSGTPTGSDRSPLYARGKTDIDIPNLKMTGSPQYGIFLRETNNVHLGHIELRLTSDAGIGIRADSGGSASTMTTFNTNLSIDYVYGSGMGSHIVETYGIDKIKIGTVEGEAVGECGLLLNRSINAEVGLVTCTDCAKGTGYAAFRVANNAGKIGSEFPAGNIHVGKVYARGGGRGIFSVSACGGLTIDEIDIANTGSDSILLQNTYNTTIAAIAGTVVGGKIKLSNDTANTDPSDPNKTPMVTSRNVKLQNLTLSGGAAVTEDWCDWKGQGDVENRAINVKGGTVDMCY